MAPLTPMMKQYREMKEQYPDALLFFRLGDFYEMFAEDALIGSKELEIVLTARDSGNGSKTPMCGVPHHAVDNYLAKLIAKGYKVAICEQVEDPKEAKGIVKRDVIRVITPGTVLESHILTDEQHNYLMSVHKSKDTYGLAYTDISTGEFMTTEISGHNALEKLIDEISRISPAECILPKELYNEEVFTLRLQGNCIGVLSRPANENLAVHNPSELILMHFKIASLESLGLQDLPAATVAVALILDFLLATQKKNIEHLKPIQVYSMGQFMLLDASTQRNLEITRTMRSGQRKGSLLWVCDSTKTAMGARLLKEWLSRPLIDSKSINHRLDGVEELYNNTYSADELRTIFGKTYDLERIIGRIASGNTSPRDLVMLKQSLVKLPEIYRILLNLQSPVFRAFAEYFDTLDDIVDLVEDAIVDEPPLSPKDGGLIRSQFNAGVNELRSVATGGKAFLQKLEASEKERTGIKSLKVGYNKVFGYYIEITNSNLSNVPDGYIRKQTLVNAERFITEELKEWEAKILTASEQLNALEYEIFCDIRKQVTESRTRIQDIADIIANIDVFQSLARVALENNYCRPTVDENESIIIHDGRHPVVEKIIGIENYVPNDTHIDNESQQLLIITGPNMTGKSTYMRQVALITLLAKIGSFVPAKKAQIGKVDRIFTRVGASDDLASGQSTFMVEMCETANILRHATRDSLVILDEIGRGTSTFDGMSIAWAVAEYLLEPHKCAKTLFATHYHELTQLADLYPLIKNYSVAVKEKDGEIIFLRKIVSGGTDKSYGIQVASLAGLPPQAIIRAKEILSQLTQDNHNKVNISYTTENAVQDTIFPMENPAEKEFIWEIAGSEPDTMTPMEALVKLSEWQQRAKKLNQ